MGHTPRTIQQLSLWPDATFDSTRTRNFRREVSNATAPPRIRPTPAQQVRDPRAMGWPFANDEQDELDETDEPAVPACLYCGSQAAQKEGQCAVCTVRYGPPRT
jgi:hypothetical protein